MQMANSEATGNFAFPKVVDSKAYHCTIPIYWIPSHRERVFFVREIRSPLSHFVEPKQALPTTGQLPTRR